MCTLETADTSEQMHAAGRKDIVTRTRTFPSP